MVSFRSVSAQFSRHFEGNPLAKYKICSTFFPLSLFFMFPKIFSSQHFWLVSPSPVDRAREAPEVAADLMSSDQS